MCILIRIRQELLYLNKWTVHVDTSADIVHRSICLSVWLHLFIWNGENVRTVKRKAYSKITSLSVDFNEGPSTCTTKVWIFSPNVFIRQITSFELCLSMELPILRLVVKVGQRTIEKWTLTSRTHFSKLLIQKNLLKSWYCPCIASRPQIPIFTEIKSIIVYYHIVFCIFTGNTFLDWMVESTYAQNVEIQEW